MAMVGCADKVLYPAGVEGRKGERKEERERKKEIAINCAGALALFL